MEDRTARFRIGQLATRTGVDPERLRKWEQRYALLEPERTPGGFRVYSREDEQRVRLMQRHLDRGYAAAEAAQLARQGIVSPSGASPRAKVPEGVVARSARLMHRAIHSYDEAHAQRALDDLFKAFAVEAVIRDALLPFLRGVGESWARGEVTPGQEHFAATLIEARLMGLTRGWGTGTGPRALLACPAGERHTLGLIAFGIALARHGWRITYLGADTPTGSIAAAAESISPSFVMLAAAQSRWLARSAEELTDLARERRVCIAGAGATTRAVNRIGAERVTEDPVTTAAEIAARKRNGPA